MKICQKHKKSFCCECRYGKIKNVGYPTNDAVTDIKRNIGYKLIKGFNMKKERT